MVQLNVPETVPRGEVISVEATSGFDSYDWFLDGDPAHAAVTDSGGGTITINTTSLSAGVHTVGVFVSDAGGTYSTQFSFTVES